MFTDEQGRNFALPFILISCLFFLSGYTNALLDVLNKYFQEVLGISKAESGLVQFSLYSGYFLMAIPAGLIINRFGFNRGLIFGLFVLIAGTALFIPGAMLKSYYVFLLALFVGMALAIHFTAVLSKLTAQTWRLTQEVGLLKARLEAMEDEKKNAELDV